MPHYVGLVQMVLRAPHRVNSAGQINLTEAEAQQIRALEFPTAVAGAWTLPDWPDFVLRVYPALKRLTEGAKQLEERRNRMISAPPPPPALTAPSARPSLSTFFVDLARRAPLDQRRILRSVLRSGPNGMRKRRLQQRLHRIRAARLNDALKDLVAKGLLVREGLTLRVSEEVRSSLLQASFGVSPAGRSRSTRRRPTKPRRRQPKLVCHVTRAGRMVFLPRTRNGRRVLPPWGTSAWGYSMRARQGGLAAQRRYRAEGRHPTEAATNARLERQRQRREAGGMAGRPQPVGADHASASVPTGVGNTGSLSGTWSHRQFYQPIGRRERLEEERNRRR